MEKVKLLGISENWFPNLIFGIIIGGVYFFFVKINDFFSLAIPEMPASLGVVGSIIGVCVVAPIIEEFTFRGVLLQFIRYRLGLGMISAIVLQAFFFSVYHWAAYGSFSVVLAAFVGAGVFGVLAGALAVYRGGLSTPIIVHAIINLLILAPSFIQF